MNTLFRLLPLFLTGLLCRAENIPPVISAPAPEAWVPVEGPNAPLGQAKGIFPGRVTWARDVYATPWDGQTGRWWDATSINEPALRHIFSKSLRALTGGESDTQSWDKLFRHYNTVHKRGDHGHLPGEGIVIKININNTYKYEDEDNDIDQSPQGLRTLLAQLCGPAGIAQQDITVYDASVGWKVRAIPDRLYRPLHTEFPGVHWVDGQGKNGRQEPAWVEGALSYTSPDVQLGTSLPTCVMKACYLINCALLKGHEMAGVTLCAKNHFGSVLYPQKDHGKYVTPMNHDLTDASALVDLMGSPNLGGKTLLYIIDGLYGMQTNVGAPQERDRWRHLFSGEWSASYFMSQDPVAIDSVGLDFLLAEFQTELGFSGAKQFPKGAAKNCDNYLLEAARGSNAILGAYRTNGTPVGSLGVHEHWNNPADKKYSRNLNRNAAGIELVQVPLQSPEPCYRSPRLTQVWATEQVFQMPESVCHDGARDCLYVSNMCDRTDVKNGLGFLSKLGLDGTVISLRWIEGLHAPKGMALLGKRLFVSGLDEIVEIDVEQGRILKRHPVEHALHLNDLVVSPEGVVCATDTKQNMLFKLDGDQTSILLQSDQVARANGLLLEGSRLLIGAKGKLWASDLNGSTPVPVYENTGYIDGLQSAGNASYVISDWSGQVQLLAPGSPPVRLLDTRPAGINAADLCYIPEKQLLLIPTFMDHRVVAFRLGD